MPNLSYLVVYVIVMFLFALYASVEMRLSLKESVRFVIGLVIGVPVSLFLLWTITAATFAM